jgi:predicted amidohydrolase
MRAAVIQSGACTPDVDANVERLAQLPRLPRQHRPPGAGPDGRREHRAGLPQADRARRRLPDAGADLDLKLTEEARTAWPVWTDRRPELYRFLYDS